MHSQRQRPPTVIGPHDPIENKGCAARTREYVSRRVFDITFAILLLIIGATTHYYPAKPLRQFFERDPLLSYVSPPQETITLNDLVVLSIVPTIGIVGVAQFSVWLCQRRRPGAIPHAAIYFWGRPLLVLGQAEGLALLLTGTLKNMQGRYRPDFFYKCNYAGYYDAAKSGNYSAYLAATTPGLPGTLDKCQFPLAWFDDARASNPSGHASSIFAAWTGMGLILVYLFRSQSPYWPESLGKAWVSLFFILPLIGCCLIIATRTLDYQHNFDDVLAGSAIGIGCSVLFFLINYGTDPSHDGIFRAWKPVITRGVEMPHEGEDDEGTVTSRVSDSDTLPDAQNAQSASSPRGQTEPV